MSNPGYGNPYPSDPQATPTPGGDPWAQPAASPYPVTSGNEYAAPVSGAEYSVPTSVPPAAVPPPASAPPGAPQPASGPGYPGSAGRSPARRARRRADVEWVAGAAAVRRHPSHVPRHLRDHDHVRRPHADVLGCDVAAAERLDHLGEVEQHGLSQRATEERSPTANKNGDRTAKAGDGRDGRDGKAAPRKQGGAAAKGAAQARPGPGQRGRQGTSGNRRSGSRSSGKGKSSGPRRGKR